MQLAPFRGLAVANKSLSKVVAKDLSLGLYVQAGAGQAVRWGLAADEPNVPDPRLLKLFIDPRDIS